MSEPRRDAAFARLRTELAAAKKRATEFEEHQEREQRVRTAYFMATNAGFPDTYTRLMVNAARTRDDLDLSEMYTTITEILAEGTTA